MKRDLKQSREKNIIAILIFVVFVGVILFINSLFKEKPEPVYGIGSFEEHFIIFTDRQCEEDRKGRENCYIKEGLMNTDGEVYFDSNYSDIHILDDIIILTTNDKMTVVEKDDPATIIMEKKIPKYVDGDVTFSNCVIEYDGDYLLDERGIYKIEKDWLRYVDSNTENIIVQDGINGEYGLIDKDGKIVIESIYSRFYPYMDNGYAVVQRREDYSYKLIDIEGNVIDEFEYDYMRPFVGQDYIVKKDDLYGVANISGEIKVELIYDQIRDYGDYLSVMKDEQFGVINDEGDIVLETSYDEVEISPYGDHVILVRRDQKWGMVDGEGSFLVDFIYDGINIRGHYFFYEKGDEMGYLDQQGDKIGIGTNYKVKHDRIFSELSNDSGYPNENIVMKESGDLYGTRDYSIQKVLGNLAIGTVSDRYEPNFLKYGVVSLDDEVIIEFQYDDIKYHDGVFFLEKDGDLFKADQEGNMELLLE